MDVTLLDIISCNFFKGSISFSDLFPLALASTLVEQPDPRRELIILTDFRFFLNYCQVLSATARGCCHLYYEGFSLLFATAVFS